MLFDLQGRRKTAIKAIYLGLAVLLGGGLVLFGVGSNVSGGLADYFTSGGSGTGTKEYQKKVIVAEAAVNKSPKNAAAHEQLIRVRYQLAGAGDNFSEKTQDFTASGKKILEQLGKDWNAYVKVADEPDPLVANFAVQSFVSLQDGQGAMSAQRVVAASREESADYLALFQYALAAGDERIANLSAKKAVKLAKPADKKQVKNQIADLRKTYKQAQKSQLSKQVQEQVNQQLNKGGGGAGGGGGLGGLGGAAPPPGGN